MMFDDFFNVSVLITWTFLAVSVCAKYSFAACYCVQVRLGWCHFEAMKGFVQSKLDEKWCISG